MDRNFDFEKHWTQINCFIPIYDHYGGNSTEIFIQNGKKIILERKTKTVLRNLAKVFALDIAQLKKKYGKLVGRKTSTPLALHPSLILLPIKARQPLVKDEGCRGYVVENKILKTESIEKNKCRIVFLDHTYIECLQSATSINLVRAHGQVIGREYQNSFSMLREERDIYQAVSALLATLDKKGAR